MPARRRLGPVALITAACAAVALVAYAGFGQRHPLERLPQPGQLRLEGRGVEPAGAGRLPVTLHSPELGPIRLALRVPPHQTGERMPVVILLVGLRTGRASVDFVASPAGTAVVGYDYPIEPERLRSARQALCSLPVLRRQALAVPGQVVAVMDWLRAQPWVDPDRISLVGVSLGALYLPAVQHLAQRLGHAVHRAVIAFGGAGLSELARHWLKRHGPLGSHTGAYLLTRLLAPLDPALHLPALKGGVLVVRGSQPDRFISEEAVEKLVALAPQGTQIVTLEGGHIEPTGRVHARQLEALVRAWLAARPFRGRGPTFQDR